MPLRNRVTPLSELVAEPGRGLVYGNRGCLHDDRGEIRRRHATKRWISCRLTFKDWHRAPLLQPGKFTELFFLDEATAFAAGHRPCALCRRADYNAFVALWRQGHDGPAGADDMDEVLHEERVDGREQRRHEAAFAELPDGAFVLHENEPHLVHRRELLRYSTAGYTARAKRPRGGTATVITPPSLLAVLATGWEGAVPVVHPSAHRPR